MENNEEEITFSSELYFRGPRFLSYFTLIILLALFSIYAIEQLIDPSGTYFIQVALVITGVYVASLAFRLKKALMF